MEAREFGGGVGEEEEKRSSFPGEDERSRSSLADVSRSSLADVGEDGLASTTASVTTTDCATGFLAPSGSLAVGG